MTNEHKQALIEMWCEWYPRVRIITLVEGCTLPPNVPTLPDHDEYAMFDMGRGMAIPCPPTVTTRDIQVALTFSGRQVQCRFPLENICTVSNLGAAREYLTLGFEKIVTKPPPQLRIVK